MNEDRPNYPFEPKSTRWLLAGQFWAVPLSDGTFGCGRIIEIPGTKSKSSRVEFLAGVLDWHSRVPPSAETIAGAACLMQGSSHVLAITRSGGKVLGIRDLKADAIEPWLFRGAEFSKNSVVMKGLAPVRPQNPGDDALPILSTWGYEVPRRIAEARFVITNA